MNNRSRATACVLAVLCLLGVVSSLLAQAHSSDAAAPTRGAAVTITATGTFDVKLTPQPPEDKTEGATLGKMSFDKQLHGDLEGTSKGQMLTAATDVEGSGAYVAMERVTGTLRGRSGSFVLLHSATMTRGTPQLAITVVPDSGSGQLAGLAGTMAIKIAEGRHSFEFSYTLPDGSR